MLPQALHFSIEILSDFYMRLTKSIYIAALYSWAILMAVTAHGAQLGNSNDRMAAPPAEPTNLWQQEPRIPKPMPPVVGSPEYNVCAQRNAYADKVYSPHMSFEELDRRHLSFGISDVEAVPHARPAVPAVHPNELVGVGSFDSFEAVLTPSHRSIYSEVHLRLETVMLCNFASCPASGAVVDIFVPGGTVYMPDGEKRSFLAGPHPYGLSSHRGYVVFLKHITEGDFYLLDKSIDITTGYAVPNDPDDTIAQQRGTWPLREMSESEVVSAISEKLAVQKGSQK